MLEVTELFIHPHLLIFQLLLVIYFICNLFFLLIPFMLFDQHFFPNAFQFLSIGCKFTFSIFYFFLSLG